MIMKEKIIQSNTEVKDINKNAAIDMTSLNWQPWPVTPSYIDKLAIELLEWACDDEIEAVRMTDFTKKKKMYSKDFWRLVQKYPVLAQAYEEAKLQIGHRRECGAIFKEYDSGSVRWGQHWYGEEWKNYDKHHADLKKIQELQDKVINALMQPTPDSDLVKQKLAEIAAKKAELKTKDKKRSK